jgi:hypothetical protein
MKLYRVFPWDSAAKLHEPNGAFFLNREKQGSTRHGIPHLDGVLYCCRTALSAVAERIKSFRGRVLGNEDLVLNGKPAGLAVLEIDDNLTLTDLTKVGTLAQLKIDPWEVATHDYAITQRLSSKLFERGAPGFLWWSSLEAKWVNVTLFESRTVSFLRLLEPVTALHTQHPDVVEASRQLGVLLPRPKRGRS